MIRAGLDHPVMQDDDLTIIRTLLGSLSFEIASRARQAGVPAYAVTAENALDAFDARILDLQLILQARTGRALQAAGRTLAGLA